MLSKLLELTLEKDSGLKLEVKKLIDISKLRKVTAKAVIATNMFGRIVGWTLVHKENSIWSYICGNKYITMTYVLQKYRRRGIGTKLIKMASKAYHSNNLSIIEWDDQSDKFKNKLIDNNIISA